MRTRRQIPFWIKRSVMHRVHIAVVFLLMFFLLSIFVNKFFVFSATSDSSAMEPAISPHCFVLVSPISAPMPHGKLQQRLSRISSVNRGDVVLVELESKRQSHFLHTLADSFVSFLTLRRAHLFNRASLAEENSCFCRIAAMPGDKIFMKDFILHVKPEGQPFFFTEFELSSKPYEVQIEKQPEGWAESIGVASDFGELTLGENEYFLLADERNASVDSRLWGAIHASQIAGKAILRYFPFSKISRL